VTQFFHLMACVEVPRGCVRLENGNEVVSVYTSCCDRERGTYHYVTYENRQICAVDLHGHDLDGNTLLCCPLVSPQQIYLQT
jgi:penicillin V acylase-like amidase (Ntn superfamily)